MTKDQLLKRKKNLAAALGSVRAEGLEPSAAAMKRLEKYAAGDMTAAEVRAATLKDIKSRE